MNLPRTEKEPMVIQKVISVYVLSCFFLIHRGWNILAATCEGTPLIEVIQLPWLSLLFQTDYSGLKILSVLENW
jgi:hypothetical protein